MNIALISILLLSQIPPGSPGADRYAECEGKGQEEFNKCMAGSNDMAKAELCHNRKQQRIAACLMLPGEVVE